MLAKLASTMDRARFDLRIVSLTDEGVLGLRMRESGLSVQALHMGSGIPNPLGLFRFVGLLRREQPTILQSWLYHADLMAIVASRLSGTPVVAWNVRNSDMGAAYYRGLRGLVVRALATTSGLVDAIVVNSEAGRRLHESLGYHPRRWELIPNGFDVERFRPDDGARSRFRAELGLAPDVIIVGLVARADPIKGHDDFIVAAAHLLEAEPTVRYVMVGHGVDENNRALVSRLAAINLREHTHLLGERSDMPAVTAAFDVAVSASLGEGFPNVVGEAMACGVPCVVTDAGDCAQIVGDTGKVVPSNSPESMAQAMNELVAVGEKGRRALGAKARLRVEEKFSLPDVVDRYEALYEELAAGEKVST